MSNLVSFKSQLLNLFTCEKPLTVALALIINLSVLIQSILL